MDDEKSYLAVAAEREAGEHLLSARKNLVGRRLPSGDHRDIKKALLHLRTAQRPIVEAIVLIESHRPAVDLCPRASSGQGNT